MHARRAAFPVKKVLSYARVRVALACEGDDIAVITTFYDD